MTDTPEPKTPVNQFEENIRQLRIGVAHMVGDTKDISDTRLHIILNASRKMLFELDDEVTPSEKAKATLLVKAYILTIETHITVRQNLSDIINMLRSTEHL